MDRIRVALAAAALLVVAYAALRALARPEPYAGLARPAVHPPGPRLVPPLAPPLVPAADPPSPASRRDPPRLPALRAALAALDAARAAGYADPVAADPDSWAARSCACHAADARRLRALARRGLALRGHRTTSLAVTLVRAGPAAATLLVADRLGPYAAVDRRGRAVARWPGTPSRRWLVTLVRPAGRWLLGAVARAP
jgi:hypothetical protein